MTTTDKFIKGLELAANITGVSRRQACIKAGVNETTLRRFMNRDTDILLHNLDLVCREGYGMSISRMIALGGE